MWFSDNLVGVELGKTEIKMNKPVYLGQVILDLSKTFVYEFHYDFIEPKYGSKVELCYISQIPGTRSKVGEGKNGRLFTVFTLDFGCNNDGISHNQGESH